MKSKLYWAAAALSIPILILATLLGYGPLLFHLGTLTLALICVVVNAFVVIYFRRSWKETPGGIAVMYSMASLATLADLSLVTNFLGPDWEFRSALRLFLFGGILIAHIHILYVLLTIEPETVSRDQASDGAE